MNISLLSLFEQNEQDFRRELDSILLPRDLTRFEELMNDFFVTHASIETYQKELSMLELSMLNSVLKLVNGQAGIFRQMSNSVSNTAQQIEVEEKTKPITETFNIPVLGTTLGGGVVGALVFKTWGGVLFSVAACALAMYLTSNKKHSKPHARRNYHIDADKYVATLKQICSSIDEVMSNYSVSLANVKGTYEKQPKPTLASLYKPVLMRLSNLWLATHHSDAEMTVTEEIDKLFRTLKNHHYEFIDYEENSQYYSITSSPHVDKPLVVRVAILENGEVLEQGECLIPESM